LFSSCCHLDLVAFNENFRSRFFLHQRIPHDCSPYRIQCNIDEEIYCPKSMSNLSLFLPWNRLYTSSYRVLWATKKWKRRNISILKQFKPLYDRKRNRERERERERKREREKDRERERNIHLKDIISTSESESFTRYKEIDIGQVGNLVAVPCL